MAFQDLQSFITFLERKKQCQRVNLTVDPCLEITEFSDRILRQNGPALLFEKPKGFTTPVLTNLFGTPERVAWALGCNDVAGLRELGEQLAYLKQPEPPASIKEAMGQLPLVKNLLSMKPKVISDGPCRAHVKTGSQVDLNEWPIQTCWPGDAGPLITWGLVVTRGPNQTRQNLGIYRQQVIAPNKVIMRWLSHRGGALDFQAWCKAHPGEKFPVSVILGTDPSTLLSAVMPIPDTMSEYAFSGLLRKGRVELVKGLNSDLQVPANAECVLEGYIQPGETAEEGPFGDHTGYYNEVEQFPVMTIESISHRKNPIYHSTYTGRPPDEPAVLGMALNELFVPLLKQQFPEIVDFYLPPEACSYRMAIVSIKKKYPGHARRIMMGIWSFLQQFSYTKFIIIVDDDINVRDWNDVMWALSTRVDPARDASIIENTPIDYLDFASPVAGLGSKIGFDATHKWQGETQREWGRVIERDADVVKRVDALMEQLESVTC